MNPIDWLFNLIDDKISFYLLIPECDFLFIFIVYEVAKYFIVEDIKGKELTIKFKIWLSLKSTAIALGISYVITILFKRHEHGEDLHFVKIAFMIVPAVIVALNQKIGRLGIGIKNTRIKNIIEKLKYTQRTDYKFSNVFYNIMGYILAGIQIIFMLTAMLWLLGMFGNITHKGLY